MNRWMALLAVGLWAVLGLATPTQSQYDDPLAARVRVLEEKVARLTDNLGHLEMLVSSLRSRVP